MGRIIAQHASVRAHGSFAVAELLAVEARQTDPGLHADRRRFGPIGQTFEHSRGVFPLRALPVHAFEHLGGPLVRRVEADGSFQLFHHRPGVRLFPGEAQGHLARPHQHGALVDVVGGALGFGEVARFEFLPAPQLVLMVRYGAGCRVVAGAKRDHPPIGVDAPCLVEQLVVLDPAVFHPELRLAVRALGHLELDAEQAGHGIPLTVRPVQLAGFVE